MTAVNDGCFLGVTRSVTGKAWLDNLSDRRVATTISQRLDLPEVLGRVLAARGVDAETAEQFLNPTLKSCLPDPHVLQDAERASARIVQAVQNHENVVVYGDYDVDGTTSTALLTRFLAAVGISAGNYIPNRLTEGYGPNVEALRTIRENGADLVITVDCGIAAHDPMEQAAALGLDIVIIDHHQAGEQLPVAHAVVNPNRQDDLSGLGYLAAVGVTFLMVVAVNRALRTAGWYGGDRPEPDLMQWLDFVALGTVCDVVPLVDLNRALVTQGLKVMARRANTGLRALGTVARLNRQPDTYAAGFVLGPRINAAGRMGRSDLAVTLLCTDDDMIAAETAQELEQLNGERQKEEAEILERALMQAERSLGEAGQASIVIVSGDGWHAGVVGIVASRLKDRFALPAIAIAFDEAGQGSGSGRSISGADLGTSVRRALEAGILVKGGGHAMAAGLTVERARLGDLRAFLEDDLKAAVAEATANPGLAIDGALGAGGAHLRFIDLLERAGPFGVGNPRPRLAFPAHKIAYADVVGDQHIRCTLVSGDGARLKAMCFRCVGTPLGTGILKSRGMAVHVAGHLSANTWGGQTTPQLIIEDLATIEAGAGEGFGR